MCDRRRLTWFILSPIFGDGPERRASATADNGYADGVGDFGLPALWTIIVGVKPRARGLELPTSDTNERTANDGGKTSKSVGTPDDVELVEGWTEISGGGDGQIVSPERASRSRYYRGYQVSTDSPSLPGLRAGPRLAAATAPPVNDRRASRVVVVVVIGAAASAGEVFIFYQVTILLSQIKSRTAAPEWRWHNIICNASIERVTSRVYL